MSDADELDDELLAVAGRPRQTPGKRRRQAAQDSDEDGMLSEVRTHSVTADPQPWGNSSSSRPLIVDDLMRFCWNVRPRASAGAVQR